MSDEMILELYENRRKMMRQKKLIEDQLKMVNDELLPLLEPNLNYATPSGYSFNLKEAKKLVLTPENLAENLEPSQLVHFITASKSSLDDALKMAKIDKDQYACILAGAAEEVTYSIKDTTPKDACLPEKG